MALTGKESFVENKGFNSVNDNSTVTATSQTIHGIADNTKINEWELKAARRALLNLKNLLYEQPMLDLIKDQTAEGDRRMKEYLAASNGEYKGTQVILNIKGVKSKEVFATIGDILSPKGGSEEELKEVTFNGMFNAHPEHYAFLHYPGVVETMGGVPTSSRPYPINDNIPDFITELVDESYPIRLIGAADLVDGTRFTYVLQQFKDTEEGLEANLYIWYPAACPPVYLEEHAEHYSIEFRNGCRLAAKGLMEIMDN